MRKSIAIAMLTVAVAACGAGSAGTAAPATTEVTSTAAVTAAPAATSVTTASTTTVPGPTSTSATTAPGTSAPTTVPAVYSTGGDPGLNFPSALSGSGGALGSGCSPGSGPLPSGIWFGYVLARTESSVTFDLACFYVGAEAEAQAAAVGEEVNNDYFISNVNPSTRTVPVAAKAVVWTITGDVSQGVMTPLFFVSEWTGAESSYTSCPGANCPMWLYVNSSVIDEMVEQYLP